MKIFVISALLFLTHTSESSAFHSSLHDQEYVNSCNSNVTQVCMNCKTLGTCTKSSCSTFVVAATEACGHQTCYAPASQNASCSMLNPKSIPGCTCATNETCKYDPNDNLSYIKCNATGTYYATCNNTAGLKVDLQLCDCVNKCASCGSYSNSETDCASYFDCLSSSTKFCSGTQCFNSTTCNCVPSTCPPCGYKPDPNNSPSGFLNCKDGRNIKKEECPGNQVFLNVSCACASCPTCGFIPDPDNAPAGYIDCKNGSKLNCSSGLIFDFNTCKCVVDPCLKCGFYAYPGDTTKYYKCVSGGSPVVYSCPSGNYFNPDTCYCESMSPPTTSTPTTTQTSDPCAYCGYFVYPADKTKYYKCVSGGSPVVGNCPTGLNFNPVACYCE